MDRIRAAIIGLAVGMYLGNELGPWVAYWWLWGLDAPLGATVKLAAETARLQPFIWGPVCAVISLGLFSQSRC